MTAPGYLDRNKLDVETCPVCGSEYTHLESILMQEGDGSKALQIPGTSPHDVEHKILPRRQDVRGHVVTLLFGCENGHSYARDFAQHKGNTFLDTRVLPPKGDTHGDRS